MGRQTPIESPTARPEPAAAVEEYACKCCEPATWNNPWDMTCTRCIFCPDDADVMNHIRQNLKTVSKYGEIYWEDYEFDGTSWAPVKFPGGGSALDGDVKLLANVSCEQNANTLYHEILHTLQPDGMDWREMEVDAYYRTEQWSIRKGLPDFHNLRKTDDYGNEVADRDAVIAFVNRVYPIATTIPETMQITGYSEYDDGTPATFVTNTVTGEETHRESTIGDKFAGEQFLVGEEVIPLEEFYCE